MSSTSSLDLKATLDSLPPPRAQDIQKSIQSLLQDTNSRIPILVALDDDPTGTQYVKLDGYLFEVRISPLEVVLLRGVFNVSHRNQARHALGVLHNILIYCNLYIGRGGRLTSYTGHAMMFTSSRSGTSQLLSMSFVKQRMVVASSSLLTHEHYILLKRRS